ncbi:MAG: thiamine-phosphate kinase [Reinekea sp.]
MIKRCFSDWSITHSQLDLGVGDDCLVWNSQGRLVISTDTAVIGRHFPDTATAEQVAQRAFLPAISDLAAMAATPAFFTLALTLPTKLSDIWLLRFADRLKILADQYQIALAGGDTTQGEQLTITVSVHGTCDQPVLRSTAQHDDDVWVTGRLGQAAAALPYILAQNDVSAPQDWLSAYWRPEPPITFAGHLQGLIHSAMDLSDGLIGDAGHLAQRSQKSLHLNLDALPLDADLKALGKTGLQYAVAGGDDYQLLFTASREQRKTLQSLARTHQVQLTCIGQVQEGKTGVHWYDGGRKITLPWQGYNHFNQ